MSSKRPEYKPTEPATAVQKPKKKDPSERVRKIGERDQEIEVKLTPLQLEDITNDVMALLDTRQDVEEQKKESMKEYGSKLAKIELKLETNRRMHRARKRMETVHIEEWLTAGNEVIQIQVNEKGEQVGEPIGNPRKARADELQEKLFPEPPPGSTPEGEPAVPAEDGFQDPEQAFGGDAP